MGSSKEIKLIAEQMDQFRDDEAAFDVPEVDIDVADVPAPTDEIEDQIPGEETPEAPEVATVDRDLLVKILELVSGVEEPEPDAEEDAGEEEVEVEEGKNIKEEDEEEGGDEDDTVEVEVPEDEIVDAKEEMARCPDCEALADKIVQMTAEKGSLSVDDFEDIKQAWQAETEGEAEAEAEGEADVGEEGEADESEADEDEADEGEKPWEEGMQPIEELDASISHENGLALADVADTQDELVEFIYKKYGGPGTRLTEDEAEQVMAIYRSKGLDDLDAPIVRSRDGSFFIEELEKAQSHHLAESVKKLAESDGIEAEFKPAKTANAVQFEGNERDFIRFTEKLNRHLKVMAESRGKGRPKYDMGAFNKYTRGYPVKGAGRLYYVFK